MPSRGREICGDWRLHSRLRAMSQHQPLQDGRIARVSRVREIVGGSEYDPKVVRIGPLHHRGYDADQMDPTGELEIKLTYLRSLILRGHADGEVDEVVTKYLHRIQEKVGAVLQQYDQRERHNFSSEDLVEMMVLDGCFIIEVIVRYWMGKKSGDLLLATDSVVLDLMLVENQIPFFVLEELFCITVIPELMRIGDGGRELLRNLAVFYLTGGAIKQAPEGYTEPIFHLLHLLHISLCLPPPPPRPIALEPPSSLVVKLRKIRLLWRLMERSSSSAPVTWLLWKLMSPAQKLRRLGVTFKPKNTPQFANITFDDQNGTLEIPPFSFSKFHQHLVSNLVAMELADSWPSTEQRLFCSYVMFMTELITAREDVEMLVDKKILACNVQEGWDGITLFARLAKLNVGSDYQCHFKELVRTLNQHYKSAYKAMRANKAIMH